MLALAHLRSEVSAAKARLIRGTGAAPMTRDFLFTAFTSLLSDCVAWFQSERRKKLLKYSEREGERDGILLLLLLCRILIMGKKEKHKQASFGVS